MKYEEGRKFGNTEYGEPQIFITQLEDDEILGHEIVKLMEEKGRMPVPALNETTGYSAKDELEKLGLSTDVLAEAWGIDAEIIKTVAETGRTPPDFTGDKHKIMELSQSVFRINRWCNPCRLGPFQKRKETYKNPHIS